MHEFLGQGLNPHHKSDLSHSSDNNRSLIHCAARELLEFPLVLATLLILLLFGFSISAIRFIKILSARTNINNSTYHMWWSWLSSNLHALAFLQEGNFVRFSSKRHLGIKNSKLKNPAKPKCVMSLGNVNNSVSLGCCVWMEGNIKFHGVEGFLLGLKYLTPNCFFSDKRRISLENYDFPWKRFFWLQNITEEFVPEVSLEAELW